MANAPKASERADNPYVGPQPFSETQQKLFYGRGNEIRELTSLIVAHREVVLYSASGAGKTSLLRAGVFPRLKERGIHVLPPARVVGHVPAAGEARDRIRNIFTYNVLRAWGGEAADVSRVSIAEYFTAPSGPADAGEPRLRVVLLDQFEELFTTYQERWQEREAFLADLAEALESNRRLRVLFAMREEYIGRLRRFAPLFPEHLRTWVQLDRLRAGPALEAVIEPVRNAGIAYAPGVAEALVQRLSPVRVRAEHGGFEEVQGEFVEPVHLQIVCHKIWSRLPEGVTEITDAHVSQFGNVDEALREYFESQLASVASTVNLSRAKLLRWFERRLITSEGLRTRLFESGGRVGGLPREVAVEFQKRYILRADTQGDLTWFELSHDRLVAPVRLAVQGQRKRQLPLQLAAAAVLAVAAGAAAWSVYSAQARVSAAQQNAAVYQEEAQDLRRREQTRAELAQTVLAVAERVRVDANPETLLSVVLATTLRAYPALETTAQWAMLTDALRYAVNGARRAASALATTKSEKALPVFGLRAATFSDDRSRLVAWGLPGAEPAQRSFGRPVVALIDLGSLQLVARVEHAQPVQALLVADRGRRVTLIERPGLPEVFDLVAAAPAERRGKGSDSALTQTLRPTRSERLSPGLLTLALAQGRGLLATGAWDGTAKIWNAGSRGELRSLTGGGPTVWDVTFNHREDLVATARDDGSVTLWDATTGRSVRVLRAHTKAARRVAFSPDDRTLVTAGWDSTIKLWDVDSGRLRATLAGHTRPVNAAQFSTSGQLASGASDGTVRLWSATGTPGQILKGHTRSVRDVSFSRDGSLLASAGADRTARVWDVRAGRLRATLVHTATVWSVDFDPAGRNLVTSSQDGVTRVWDLSTGRTTAELKETAPSPAPANEAFFSNEGDRVVTVSSDDTLRWWNWRAQREEARIWGHATNAASASVALDRAGARLALVDSSGMVRLVDARTESTQQTFQTGQTALGGAAFSPDGKVLATLGADPPLRFWDAATGKPLETIDSPRAMFTELAFDATGARVAGAGPETAPVVWTRGGAQQPLADPRVSITSLSFNPAGDLLAGASEDRRLFVWSLKTGYLIGVASMADSFRDGESPLAIAFTADGAQLMVASRQGLETLQTESIYDVDVTRLMASAFEQLPPSRSALNRGIAEALRGQISMSVATIAALSDGRERETADRLKLLDHLRQGTFTPAVLSDYFDEEGAVR